MASDYDLIILLLVEENFVVIVESLVDRVSNSGIINIASDPDLNFETLILCNQVQPEVAYNYGELDLDKIKYIKT